MLATLVLVSSCAGSRPAVAVSDTTARQQAAVPLTPEQIANGLDDLTVRIRERINATSDRIDDGADNAIRRRTLRFRMRASDVTWRSQQNPNKLAGVVELWFWMTVVDEFSRSEPARESLGDRVTILQELGRGLHSDVEAFARQTLPGPGFDSLKQRIEAAAAKGEVLTASPQREQAIIGDLLEVTKLQSVLGIALSPFEALRGIGTGGDAVASLTVTADRAVDLMVRYPEIIAWNLRLAVIDIEEQDTVRETRAALQQAMQQVDAMPAKIRGEVQTLLASSEPSLKQAQDTLRELSAASAALTALSGSLQQTIAAVKTLIPEPAPAGSAPAQPGRPFDIREYTAAIQAAEAALKEARTSIATATAKGMPAVDAAAARFEASADRILLRIGWLLAFAAVLAAGIIILRHRLGRRG
ncbi:MAG: hypothetical protein J0M02_13760 [Planctomycetes bacterium]|nr:hypothetical protein [Planctomycetota bacterium]